MKGRIICLAATCLVTALSIDPARAQTRIMPLGDSITHGDSAHNSYRRPLWQMLTNASYNVDLVGSTTSNNGGPPPNPDFDLNHEGHAGYRSDELVSHLPGWLAGYTPDIVLLHIGHNDIFQGQTTATTVNEIKQIIDVVRTDNPSVVILLAKIIPHTDATVNSKINDLNAQMDGIAGVKTTVASPVLVVDQNAGYNAASDNYDGTHPNAAGEQKLANKWFAALQTVIEPPSFYRAINVGGGPLMIDGRSWEGQTAPNYSSVGTVGEYPSFDWIPATDEARSNMLRTFVFANVVELTLSALPNGTYDVYAYTFEDNNPLTATLFVQGTAATTYMSGPAGRWDRLGPFRAAVTNGQLQVRYEIAGGDLAPLCGLEVWRYPTPPTVQLTSPSDGSAFFAPAVLSLAADAADSDGSVTNVEFFAGNTKLGQDTSSAYEFIWNNVEEGNYALTAVATDNAGKQTRSTPVNVLVQASASGVPAPIIKLSFDENSGTSTVNAGTAGGLLTLTSSKPTWSGNVPAGVGGTSSLDFGMNAGDFAVDSPAAISALGGLSRFTITGWLNNRSATEGAGGNRVVTWINNGGDGADLVYRSDGSLALGVDQWPDSTPARSSAAKIPTDSAGAGNWRFFAVTYDSTVSTGQVKFYFGSNGSDATLDVARTYSGRGAVGTGIGQLTIGHLNPATRASALDRVFRGRIDHVQIFGSALNLAQITSVQRASAPPSVALSSPLNGSSFTAPANMPLRAGAADSDGMVTLVEFFQGSTKVGQDTSSPYEFTWANVPEGMYSLTARATDDTGRLSTSAVVNVTVSSTFYRAINVGGPALVIDGQNWEGQTTTNYQFAGNVAEYPSFNFNPALDPARSNMMRSFIFADNVEVALTAVPSGTYQVYLYTFEDNVALTARVRVEGVLVSTYTSGPEGRWDRLGPFNVNVSDGTLNVRYEVQGGDLGPICGLEVRRFELPPQPPTGVVAVAGDSRVTLSWSPAQGASTYNIKRSTTSGAGYVTVASGVGATSFTNTALVNDTTYYYVVSAVNAAGESLNSAEVSAFPNAGRTPIVRLAFDESSGTTTTNSGLAGGVLNLTAPTPAWTVQTAPGLGGAGAVDFGTAPGDFAVESSGPINGLRGLTGFTICGWVNNRSDVAGPGGNRILTWLNNGGDGVDLVSHSDGSLQVGIDQWPDFSPARSSSGRIPVDASAASGNWRFFAVTYDSSLHSEHVKFYFGSGAEDAALDVARSYPGAGAVGTSIGSLSVGHFNSVTRLAALDRMFRGLIDHVQIFRTALSAPDLVAVQRGGGIAPPSVALTSPTSAGPLMAAATIDFQASASDSDGTVALVEFFAGNTKVGEDLTSPYQFTWSSVPEGVYSLTARATDDTGRTGISVPVTVQVQNPSTLYRAINVGGVALSINGEPWEGHTTTNYSAVGILGEYPSFAFDPPVDGTRSNMLRSFVFDHVVLVTLSNVPPSVYDVYVHTFEDNFPLVGNLFVQEALVTTYRSGPTGRWDRLGPYRVVLTTNGLLSVRYDVEGGDYGPICGLEVRRVQFPPEAPTGLLAIAGSERVTLNWTAPPDATSYNIKRSLVDGSGYTNLATGVAATTFTDLAVSNQVTYYYVVSAANSVGEGPASAQVAAMPSVPRPIVKLGFNEGTGPLTTNTGSAGGTLGLTPTKPRWTNNAPADVGWNSAIDFGTNTGNFAVESDAPLPALGGLTAFTITGWLNNRSATEGAGGNRVISWINNGGDGVDLVYRADGSLHLGVDQWPDTSPARSSAGKITSDASAASGNWRFFAVSYDDASSQVKFYFGAQGTNAVLDVTRTYAGRGAVNTNLGRLSVGHFNILTRASATNRMFRGLFDDIQIFGMALSASEIDSVRVATDVPPPAPLGLAALPGNAQVELSWLPSPFAMAYDLRRSTDSGGPYADIATGLTGTNYVDSGVSNDVTYYYRVAGVTIAGPGESSSIVSATPMAPPTAPLDLQAVAMDAQVSLSWSAVSNAARFILKRSLSSGSGYSDLATNVLTTDYTDSDVTNGTTYYYVVAAANNGGESPASNEALATPIPPPEAPANLVALAGNAEVALTWAGLPDVSGYLIKRSLTSGAGYVEVANGVIVTSFTDTGLVNGTPYFYVVSALNAVGEGPNSTEAAATPLAPPAAPASLIAQAGDAQIALHWPASPNAATYTLKQALISGGAYSTVAAGLTSTTFTNTELANGTTYYYVVSAVNAAGESPDSTEASATPLAPPEAPANLVAAAGNTLVVLNWSASSNALSYTLKVSTNSGSGYTNLATALSATTFTNTDLSNGTTYYYVVVAVNGSGESPDSLEASATPMPEPSAPSNLQAAASQAQVFLTWTASPSAATYTVKRSTTSGSGYAIIAGAVSSTQFTDTGLANGTTYYYVVSAANESGESPDSSEASATPLALPAAPGSLQAVAGNQQVSLTWSASPGADSYTVKRATTSGGGYTTIGSGLATPTLLDAGLVNNVTYYYVVSAVNASGEGLNSVEAAATPTPAPAPPADLTAVAGNALVRLNWLAASNALSYTLKVSTNSGAEYTQLAAGLISTTFTNVGLSNGTTYYYVVSAVNGSGESSNSVEASAMPMPPPAPPTALDAVAGSAKVVLTWTASATAASYTVKRSVTSGSGYTTVTTGLTSTTFTNAGLVNGTTYYYVVSASNGSGEGAASLEVSATPLSVPPGPGNLQAAPGNGRVNLSWSASANAVSYTVKRSTTSGTGYSVVASGVTGTGYLDQGVLNEVMYYYVVSAANGSGEGPNSAQASAMPLAPPDPPTHLSATAGGVHVNLSWVGATHASGYNVKRSLNNGGPYTTVASGVPTLTYVDNGLVAATVYYYVVSAVNFSGESADSAPASAAVPDMPVPIIKLSFNEGVGTLITNSGSAVGLFQATAPTPQWTTNAPDPVGARCALDFQTSAGNYGVDSAAVIPELRSLGAFTVTGWLNNRSSAQGAGGNRIISWVNFGGDGLDLVYKSDGSLQMGIDEWADKSPARSSAGKIPTDATASATNWRFFAITYSSNLNSAQVKFYFGSPTQDAGLDVARGYSDRGSLGTSIGRVTVGHLNPSSRSFSTDRLFRGLLDDVRFYGRVLTPDEVVAVQRAQDAPIPAQSLEILGITRLQNGLARLRLSGPPQATCRILASSTLNEWTVISTNVFGLDGKLEFDDPDSNLFPNRFYRAATP